jgi:hypothetical protein
MYLSGAILWRPETAQSHEWVILLGGLLLGARFRG